MKRKRDDNQRVEPDREQQPGEELAQATTSQHNLAQGAESFGQEHSAAVQSPPLLLQQDSITPKVQPFQLDGLQSGPGTGNQHGHVLIRGMEEATVQDQSNITAHQVTNEQASKRPRFRSHQFPGNPELPGQGAYCSFSFTRRHMIENVPEPFRTGMKTSNLWRKEKERGGLAVTNCLSIYLPETLNEDALLVIRIGCFQGFNICALFGLGEPDTPDSEGDAAKEAGDSTLIQK